MGRTRRPIPCPRAARAIFTSRRSARQRPESGVDQDGAPDLVVVSIRPMCQNDRGSIGVSREHDLESQLPNSRVEHLYGFRKGGGLRYLDQLRGPTSGPERRYEGLERLSSRRTEAAHDQDRRPTALGVVST